MTEDDIESLSDEALITFWSSLEVDDPQLEAVLGEIERRNLDI